MTMWRAFTRKAVMTRAASGSGAVHIDRTANWAAPAKTSALIRPASAGHIRAPAAAPQARPNGSALTLYGRVGFMACHTPARVKLGDGDSPRIVTPVGRMGRET